MMEVVGMGSRPQEGRKEGCFWCSVLAMKIMSWNVRGLGSFEKRREVRHLVREKKPFICCLQETELSVFDFAVCKYLWGDESVDFYFQSALGASGGIVSMWDTNEVEVWSSISFNHALVILGHFVKTGEHFTVFNVYAPCDSTRSGVWRNVVVLEIIFVKPEALITIFLLKITCW